MKKPQNEIIPSECGTYHLIIINSPKYGRREVKIDSDQIPLLSQYRWYLSVSSSNEYAEASGLNSTGPIKMHRLLMPGADMVDHVNSDGLDNRLASLRKTTPLLNAQNKKYTAGKKVTGAHFNKKTQKWEAYLSFKAKKIHLGRFDDFTIANKAHVDAKNRLHELMSAAGTEDISLETVWAALNVRPTLRKTKMAKKGNVIEISADGQTATIEINSAKYGTRYAIIDAAHVAKVSQFTWGLYSKTGHAFYATTTINTGTANKHTTLHAMLHGTVPGKVIDHIDGNGLNNRLDNLRAVSAGQNSFNRKTSANGKKTKGYCWNKERESWQAAIKFKNRVILIGRYFDEHEAAAAYEKARVLIESMISASGYDAVTVSDIKHQLRTDKQIV